MSSVSQRTPDDFLFQAALKQISTLKGRVKELEKLTDAFLLFLYSEEEKVARCQEYARFANICGTVVTQDFNSDQGNVALVGVNSTNILRSTVSNFLTCFTNLRSVRTLYIVFNFHGTSDGSLVLKTFAGPGQECVAIAVDTILDFIEEQRESILRTYDRSHNFYFPDLTLIFPQCHSHRFDKDKACLFTFISDIIWFTSEYSDFPVSLEQGRYGRVHTSLMDLATKPFFQQSLRLLKKDQLIDRLGKKVSQLEEALADERRRCAHAQPGIEEARDMAESIEQGRLHEEISQEWKTGSIIGSPQIAVSTNFHRAYMTFLQGKTRSSPGNLQVPISGDCAIGVHRVKFLPENCCDRFSHPDRRSGYLRSQPDGTLANDRGHVYYCASLSKLPRNFRHLPNLEKSQQRDFYLLGSVTLRDATLAAMNRVPLELKDSNRNSLDLNGTVCEWFTSGVGHNIYVVQEE